MASKGDKEKQKQVIEKCQAILSQLLRDDDNKYCVDCDAKGPRWAAWNLGIFLCIRCAGIHRNLGVHISKVKSVNLDSWTPEQVAYLQQMGNSRGRAVYEANLPDSFRRPQTDSSLEAFIRAKYEQKKYIAREWVPPPMPKPAFDYESDKKKIKADKKTSRQSRGGIDILPPVKNTTTARPKSETSAVDVAVTAKVDSKSSNGTHSGTADLLGLDDPGVEAGKGLTANDEDPFGGFLAASNSSSELTLPSNRTEEENNLFLQPGVEDIQKKQMTKESILSLYNSTPALQQQQQQVMGIPGGMYVGQPYAQHHTPVVGQTPIGGNVNRGVANVPGMMGPLQTPDMLGTNPFLASAPCPIQHPGFNQIHQQMASLSMGAPGFPAMGPYNSPNVGPMNVPGMNWNAQQMGHTLSTNLWQ